jgi:hypothetical protein
MDDAVRAGAIEQTFPSRPTTTTHDWISEENSFASARMNQGSDVDKYLGGIETRGRGI